MICRPPTHVTHYVRNWLNEIPNSLPNLDSPVRGTSRSFLFWRLGGGFDPATAV